MEEPYTTDDASSEEQGASPTMDELESELYIMVEDYYEAVNDDDWAYTYSQMASGTQSGVTEEEWAQKNQWFEDVSDTTYTPVYIEASGTENDPVTDVEIEVFFAGTGDIQSDTPGFVYEVGGWKRQMT